MSILSSYDLFYGSGGSGGPYFSLKEAVETAARRLNGSASERSIRVRQRETNTDVVKLYKKSHEDGGDYIQVEGENLLFGQCRPGDHIYHNGYRYVVTRETFLERLTMNAVRLHDGEPTQFNSDVIVSRVVIRV